MADPNAPTDAPEHTGLKQTALNALHRAHDAKLVEFAGHEMPLQFEGVKAEHLWTRAHAGLFDVSHMGPCFLTQTDTTLTGEDAHKAVAAIIERLVPSNIAGLKPGQARLSVLLGEDGGILDDLIITRPQAPQDQGTLYIVVNGAVKERDFALIAKIAGGGATLWRADETHVLFALQGPDAGDVFGDHLPDAVDLAFMRSQLTLDAAACRAVSRCGYTGEDGFECLMPADTGVEMVARLLDDPRVKPIGLGARDSLRLEAGLCLYGHDMDETRDPVEADLAWVIQKRRREAGDFPGAQRILAALAEGPGEKRVGIRPLEKAPAREGTEIFADGARVGVVTSGGFGPSVGHPVAMGYIRADLAAPGTRLDLMVRGKARPAEVADLPFITPNYKR